MSQRCKVPAHKWVARVSYLTAYVCVNVTSNLSPPCLTASASRLCHLPFEAPFAPSRRPPTRAPLMRMPAHAPPFSFPAPCTFYQPDNICTTGAVKRLSPQMLLSGYAHLPLLPILSSNWPHGVENAVVGSNPETFAPWLGAVPLCRGGGDSRVSYGVCPRSIHIRSPLSPFSFCPLLCSRLARRQPPVGHLLAPASPAFAVPPSSSSLVLSPPPFCIPSRALDALLRTL